MRYACPHRAASGTTSKQTGHVIHVAMVEVASLRLWRGELGKLSGEKARATG
jgi:hypothetical protein